MFISDSLYPGGEGYIKLSRGYAIEVLINIKYDAKNIGGSYGGDDWGSHPCRREKKKLDPERVTDLS